MAALPESYKAVRLAAANAPWEIVTLPVRAPAPTEVLVRVHASGICYSDHFAKTGGWPGIQYPRTPGHEVVGRIAAVGSAVRGDRFAVGALAGVGFVGSYCRACALCRKGEFWACAEIQHTGFSIDGGHAEFIYAPETAIVSLPEEILEKTSYAQLAPLLCAGATVNGAILASKWAPGDLCVVQGVGGLGHLAIQYAAKLGLKVYAVSSGAAKKDLALSLGAHGYIDASATDATAAVQALGGANLIVCTAPYADQISALIPAVAKNGTVMLVAAAADKPIAVLSPVLNFNRAALRGFLCGPAGDAEDAVKLAALTDIKTIVQEYPLDQFAAAYDAVIANRARFRNVIVFP